VPEPVSKTTVLNNSASSSAATDVIKKLPIFPSSLKYRCQFVAALEDVGLLCTVVLDTGTSMYNYLASSAAANTMIVFVAVAALEDAEFYVLSSQIPVQVQ
jgi:hypothetical protein